MSLDVYLKSKKCTCCGRSEIVYEANITHNLNKMAEAAGIYEIVWRPEKNGIDTAGQLIEPLQKAIAEMKADPKHFKKHDYPNGWGSYENFVPWLELYLAACIANPDAEVSVWR